MHCRRPVSYPPLWASGSRALAGASTTKSKVNQNVVIEDFFPASLKKYKCARREDDDSDLDSVTLTNEFQSDFKRQAKEDDWPHQD